MRTDEEILERIELIEKDGGDSLGIQRSDLIFRLPFSEAKKYLKPEVTADEYQQLPRDRESLIAQMLDYMPFAWEKANNCRGISAYRNMDHYTSWIWLAGDDLGDLFDYQHYGKEKLRMICAHYGFDADQWDDGVRTNG